MLDLVDSTASGNTAGFTGGGIATAAGAVTLTAARQREHRDRRVRRGITNSSLGVLGLVNTTITGNSAGAFASTRSRP